MTIAIVGRTGSGKSYAAKTLIEPMLAAGERVCIIDPTGAHWGLSRHPDGKMGRFAVIVYGGDHADIPLDPDQGEQMADLMVSLRPITPEEIATEGGPYSQIVLDVSDMSGNEQTKFLTAFLERLYAKNKHPLTLVIDEADIVAPQNPLPEQRRLQGAANKIVRRGRIKGFTPIMITQRPAVLDKSVLSQIDTLVAMRLTSPQDRKAIEEWVKGNADADEARKVLDSLASLPRGEGWFWAPHDNVLERRVFPAITTYDSSRAPEPGEHIPEITGMSRAEVSQREYQQGAGNEAAIRAEIDRLTAEIAKTDKEAFTRGYLEAVDVYRPFIASIRGLGQNIVECCVKVAGDQPKPYDIVGEIRGLAAKGEHVDVKFPVATDILRADKFWTTSLDDLTFRTATPPLVAHLNSAARKMLAVLDTNPPVQRTWRQVATLAGLKARGGHFNAGRKALIDSGLVRDGELVRIETPSSAATVAPTDPAALVETWCANLSGAAPKILRSIFAVGGRVPRATIAAGLNMQPRGGHWNAAWKELRDNDIVEIEGDYATLTELFHPKGTE